MVPNPPPKPPEAVSGSATGTGWLAPPKPPAPPPENSPEVQHRPEAPGLGGLAATIHPRCHSRECTYPISSALAALARQRRSSAGRASKAISWGERVAGR